MRESAINTVIDHLQVAEKLWENQECILSVKFLELLDLCIEEAFEVKDNPEKGVGDLFNALCVTQKYWQDKLNYVEQVTHKEFFLKLGLAIAQSLLLVKQMEETNG